MRKLIEKAKKTEGFTLVELIVVIAILAILAAVAIPAYSGYIAKAHDAATLTDLDVVLTAAQSKCAELETTVSSIAVTVSGTTVTVTVTPASGSPFTDLTPYYTGSPDMQGSYASGAYWYAAGDNAETWLTTARE